MPQTREERRAKYQEWKQKKLAEDPEYFRRYFRNYDKERGPRHRKNPRTEKRKQWEATNRDKLREYQRDWREKNRDRVRELRRDSYWRDPERELSKARAAYNEQPEKRYQRYVAARHTLKGMARYYLNEAVRLGAIVKPSRCERCKKKVAKLSHPRPSQ